MAEELLAGRTYTCQKIITSSEKLRPKLQDQIFYIIFPFQTFFAINFGHLWWPALNLERFEITISRNVCSLGNQQGEINTCTF